MDLDSAKENIMPLAGGRDARCLETVLSVESHHEILTLLQKQREEYEKTIHEYEGDDPLEPWFNYIQWIEQSYPSGGKENGLIEVLLKCLTTFETEERYFQDRRMIKLFIKYIDTQSNPQEYYQELYNQGVGTMVADLYICWAYYYDVCGNFAKADEVFRKGLDARAQPLDELEQAHKHFGFTMSQRILYKDEESNMKFLSSMQERRQALTSLRAHKKKVGSIRTGAAVKSQNPGKVEISTKAAGTSGGNIAIKVFEDQNHNPNEPTPATPAPLAGEAPTPHSIIRSIVDSSRKQENMREPGPWSKARMQNMRKGSLFGTAEHHHTMGFEILNDEDAEYRAPLPKGEDNVRKGIQLPPNFIRTNIPLPKWNIPLTSDPGEVGPNVFPQYEKTILYPSANEVYCPEEYAAWCWLKKRGRTNAFVEKRDAVWLPESNYGFYYYPKFCKKNEKQSEFATERFCQDEDQPSSQVFRFPMKEVYPENSTEEFQIEEIRWKRLKEGTRKLNLNTDETIIMQEDLDETQCAAGAFGRDRRSVFYSRKSIAPRMSAIVEQPHVNLAIPGKSIVSPNTDEYSASIENSRNKMHEPVHSELTAKEKNDQLQTVQSACDAEICATTEKIRDFSIFQDDEPPRKEEQQLEKNFEIYEDPNVNSEAVFKAPQTFSQGVARPGKPRMSVAPTREDQGEEKTSLYGANESCSTQTFNFFIKAQSVSTPKNLKKSQSHITQPQERSAQVDVVSPPTPPIDMEALSVTATTTQFPPKQLSVIMETTETNTGSSGTKSTAETQDFDSESTKSNQTTKILNTEHLHVLDAIMEVSGSQKPSQTETSRATQPVSVPVSGKEDDIPAMMSMKVFEDKTETVPKMMVVKPQSQLASVDNFDILFTTTPPKSGGRINSTALNESLTFSKLSEITLPKAELLKYTQNEQPVPGISATASGQSRMIEHGSTSKKKDIPMPDGFEVNDSMTFSHLKNFTFSNLMEKSQHKTFDKSEQHLKAVLDKSTKGNSPHPAIVTTAALSYEKKFKAVDFNNVSQMNLLEPIEQLQRSTQKIALPQTAPCCDETNTTQKDMSLGNLDTRKSKTMTKQTVPRISQIHEQSLHIKEEPSELRCGTSNASNSSNSHDRSILSRFSAITRRQSKLEPASEVACSDANFQAHPPSVPMLDQSIVWYQDVDANAMKQGPTGFCKDVKNEYCDLGRSIYIKASPKTPTVQRHFWVDDSEDCNDENNFVHEEVDLNQTKQLIDLKIENNVNPFDRELIKAFLDQIEICSYLEKLPTCMMGNRIQALQKGSVVSVADRQFDIVKLVGEGSYGNVFCAKERSSGKLYAVKQERPANLWEYYICLELSTRISANMMPGFMNVEYAVIGNNASLLITQFAKYGSLINVCHKFYASAGKNIDEYVVMVIASQLLSIMDHLHASNIIHADIKPDNFLLMSKLSYPSKVPSVQLIDFGVSIDLRLFQPKQKFTYVTRTQGFTCIEMLEKRPWTYQPDLFGLAGTIHALLFGKYMDVEQKGSSWGIKAHMPRYFSKTLWNTVFNTLLNVRDCNSMPNLQYLRGLLEEEIVEKEKIVKDKIIEFNLAIDSK